MIPVFRPSITQAEIDAVTEVLKSGWLGLGPVTAKFEEEFAKAMGVPVAVGFNSGTAALHLGLMALGVKEGDEVIVPTITFVSTAMVAEYLGAKPVFVDVEPDTLCMSVEDVRRKITRRTKAIVPVHYGGHPCDMDALASISVETGIPIMEDAAHACGTRHKDRVVGSISPMTCFSFHAVKNLTTGEGGMVTAKDPEMGKLLRELRWMGISKDTWDRTEQNKVYAWQYWVRRLGFKAHLSDIAAAIGRVQLTRLEELNRRRREIVGRYDEALRGLDWLQTPPERPYARSSWHIYHVKTDARDNLIAHLKKHDIAPGVHYYPIHLHPYYREKSPGTSCPVAEEQWKRIVTLPLYPDLTDAQVDQIIEVILDFGGQPRRRAARIKAQGVALREIGSADLEVLDGWRKDDTAWRLGDLCEGDLFEWFNQYLRSDDRVYVFSGEDGKPAGALGISKRAEGEAEIDRILVPASTRGATTEEALRALLRNAIQNGRDGHGLERIQAGIPVGQAGLQRLLENAGLRAEGIQRGGHRTARGRVDRVLLGWLRE